jgi:hypothetical protein
VGLDSQQWLSFFISKIQGDRMAKQTKKTEWWQVLLAVVIVIAPIAIWLSQPEKPAAPKAEYAASVIQKQVVDPATVNVSFVVKNTSKLAGTPKCTVSVQNSSGVYKGANTFQGKEELAAGASSTYTVQLVVNEQGAGFVTEGAVSCE